MDRSSIFIVVGEDVGLWKRVEFPKEGLYVGDNESYVVVFLTEDGTG